MLKSQNRKPKSEQGKSYSSFRKICSRGLSCFAKAGARFKSASSCSLSSPSYFGKSSLRFEIPALCFSTLLLIAFCAINPLSSSSASALEEASDSSSLTSPQNAADTAITPLSTTSTVNISFTPSSGSTSLTPTTTSGQSAQINVAATVSVQNSGGYTVYLKSNSANLVGEKNSNNVIPGATTAKTYNDMDINTWGYTAAEGSIPDNATYTAPSVSGNGDKLVENTNKKITSDTKNIMLSFAAKVNDQKPADTYKNTVTMSVVSSPLKTTLSDITNMQNMTNSICSDSDIHETKQLRDTRDGKYYWVTKLADNKCWMTQNLDLDLSTKVALTPSDSDVASNWTPGFNTATEATVDTINIDSPAGTRSWSLGDYRIINPTISSDCGHPKNDFSQCPAQFTPYATPTTPNNDELAHYIAGNHYQWDTATAETGGSITEGQAASSICPRGWRLPTPNDANAGSFDNLVYTYSIGMDVAKFTSAPLYFVRSSYVSQSVNYLLSSAGDYGYYWSSNPYSATNRAYTLHFSSNSYVGPSTTGYRQDAFSVRCIAR